MVTYERSRRLADCILALEVLGDVKEYYPGFEYWYVNTCMPGIVVGDDVLVVARDGGKIVGAALGRRGARAKLRCVRMAPGWRGAGAGLRLIEAAMRELECDKPHCTVCEEMMGEFSRAFVNRYGFELSRVEKGMYRKDKLEYVFNAPKEVPGGAGGKEAPWAG